MKKKLLVIMLAVMTVCMLSACGSNKTSGGKVYWLNFKPESDQAMQELAAAYTEETGVEVKVVTAAEGTYQETLTAEMDKDEAPTLFVVGNQEAVKTWGEYCYDLTDSDIAKELATDAYNLYDADGKLCSIGYCYEAYGIITNKTLLEKAGYTTADITDFASLKKVADDIHARADELGFDAFTSAGLDDSSSWRFSGHLANMPLYYESVADGWTECPAEIKGTYLDLYKNIWDLYTTDSAVAPATLATGGYDAEAEFGNGEAVFYQNGTWEWANLTGNYGMTADQLTMIPIYCGADDEANAGLCCGTENCWAVNGKASEEDIAATIDFMKWMVTSEAGTKAMAEQFGPCPYKSAATPENVFFADAKALTDAGKTTITWAFNYTPNVEQWRAGVVQALTQYSAGSADWTTVEDAFVGGWATQYKAVNE